MRVINQVVPFMNPPTQGAANMLRTMRDHPARFAALAALFSGVAATVRLNNMRFETSELIPDYEYIRYWIVQYGEGTRKDGTKFPLYARIPKGEFIAAATFPVEAIFHTARANEDRSSAEMLLDAGINALEVVSPIDIRQGVFAVTPPVIGTAAGVGLGVDPFTKRPIVSQREQGLLPEQQYGPETSSIAIKLGQTFGISPRKIDFAIKDYTAGAGKASLWLTDMALEVLGYKKPEPYGAAVETEMTRAEALSRTPLGRLFGTKATQLETRGWEAVDKASTDTQREFSKLPGVNALGVRLGEVGNSFDMTPWISGDSIDLTPQQRAEYQELMGKLVTPLMREYLAILNDPGIQPPLTSERKKELAQKRMSDLKTFAAEAFRIKLRPLQPLTPTVPTTKQPTRPLEWEAAGVR